MVQTQPNLAAYGHIASLLRSELAKRKLNTAQFAKAIGATSSGVSYWLTARGAPNPEMRDKVVKLLGVNPGDLIKKGNAVMIRPEPERKQVTAPVATKEILTFGIADNGMARLRLDITLPFDTAKPILDTLLDAGLVFNKGE